ncbi:ATP-binding protein [Bordetella trematum]|uniref:ATP-binding protein n=1 Tax=Bordetella trematum TaxID=123899 RepID=UPI0039895A5A
MHLSRRLLLGFLILLGLLWLGTQLSNVWVQRQNAMALQQQRAQATAASLALAISQHPGQPQDWLARLPPPAKDALPLRIDDDTSSRSFPYWNERAAPAPGMPILARSAYRSADGASQGEILVYGNSAADPPVATLHAGLIQALLFLLAALTGALYLRRLSRTVSHAPFDMLLRTARGEDTPARNPVAELQPLQDALAANREQHEQAIEHLQQRIVALENEATRDAITRLANRKTFFDVFRATLRNDSPRAHGHVLIFRQRDMAEINRSMLHEGTDQWLRLTAAQLQHLITELGGPRTLLARLNGSDFAALLPDLAPQPALLLAEKVRRELRLRRLPLLQQEWCRWAIALGAYETGEQVGAILARLDNALMRAEASNSDTLQLTDHDDEPRIDGEYRWQALIMGALEEHRFYLEVQTRHDQAGRRVHEEASLVLGGPQALPASAFMPAAARLGLAIDCDIQALRLALDDRSRQPGVMMLPLTPASMASRSFLNRAGRLLQDRPAQARQLILQIEAQCLIDDYDNVRALCALTTEVGARVGINRVSEHLTALEKLHLLPVVYIKVGGAFVHSLPDSPANRQLAATLARSAQAAHAVPYAIDVHDDTLATLAQSLGFTVLQPLAGEHEPAETLPPRPAAPLLPALPDNLPPSQRKRQDQSTQRLSEMAGALQSQRQFQALLSHELRTPAATISAAAQSLETILAGSGQEVDSRLARIRRAVGRITTMLEQMLDPERNADQAMAPRLENVELGELARDLCHSMQPDSAHPLIVRADDAVPVLCDPLLTSLVLRNLIQNAIKYSPANQPVLIDAGLSSSQDGTMAWLAVSDHGPGLNEEDTQRIFEPHYRREEHRETPGTGLGLHLAREICISQGGSLTAQAQPGQGARFVIALPAAGLAGLPADGDPL